MLKKWDVNMVDAHIEQVVRKVYGSPLHGHVLMEQNISEEELNN